MKRPIFTSLRYFVPWSLAVLILNAGLSWAGFTPPKNLSRPGNREGAATRGICRVQTGTNEPDLTTLVPASNIGLTVANRPTFYWYLPANNYQALEFALFQTLADGTQVQIYKQQFPMVNRRRLDSITLAGDVPPLQEGVDYRWTVSLICNPNDSDPSQIRFVEGWVQRVTLPESLNKQLRQASPLQRYGLLASNGLWYDALDTLVKLRQEQPTDPKVNALWTELMTAEEVGLNRLSNLAIAQRSQRNLR
ncbi:DUF928 domain-containing protein [Thermosynechococcus sp. HN-54]|uniref:DUF928 domain-containing protein n=1 Tax=Thermosynechococcus sp. HN-54 TaxID=2933959 RepID=UPI00202CE80C|nr:DUF928 domain-containing protein [Thermosynechococcus sp. HN-54]URR36599.1 DUF928 domain-containing protein [Thermosynechococcus sp. HN-54]